MHVENNVSSAGNLQICPIKVFSQQIPCMLTNECVKLSLGPHETHFKQEETGLAVKWRFACYPYLQRFLTLHKPVGPLSFRWSNRVTLLSSATARDKYVISRECVKMYFTMTPMTLHVSSRKHIFRELFESNRARVMWKSFDLMWLKRRWISRWWTGINKTGFLYVETGE